MGARRVAAGLLDMALLVLPGLLLAVFSETAAFIYIALFTFTATLYFATFHVLRAQTPGKRLFHLRVTGTGCILCRELRKCAVLFLPMIATAAHLVFTRAPLTPWDFWWLRVTQSGLLVLAICFVLFPIITLLFNKSPHWDRATGFTVVPNPPSL